MADAERVTHLMAVDALVVAMVHVDVNVGIDEVVAAVERRVEDGLVVVVVVSPAL